MAKKDNEQIQWLTPTQMAEVFVDKFDTKTLEDITTNIAKFSYEPWIADQLKLFLDHQASNKAELSHDAKKFLDMLEMLHYAMTHSETPEAEAFLSSFKFLSQFKYFVDVGASNDRGDLYTQSFLSQIDSVITDSKIKAALLLKCADRAFYCARGADVALVNMLAKNDETITVAQWEDVLNKLTKRFVSDFGVAWTIVEKMEVAAVKEIQAERSKVPYDIKALEKISKNIQNTLHNLMDKVHGRYDAQEIQNRLREIVKKYDLSSILKTDLEALGKLPKSGYELATSLESEKIKLQQKISELENQKKALEQQLQGKDREIEKINQELATTRQALSESQSENRTLSQENTKLTESKESSEKKLTRLIEGARQIKSGLGSRGVNEYKQMVEDIEATIIR